MGKRNENNSRKISFLRKVLELKGQLFGAFSQSITKDTKKNAWIEVRDFAVSIGLITVDKDFTYVRDATWPNLRSRTVTKVDNAKKTGTEGGTNKILDEIDHLVLEIIGKQSPVFQGCGATDSFGESGLMEFEPNSQNRPNSTNESVNMEGPSNRPTLQSEGNNEVGDIPEPVQQQELLKPRGPLKKRVAIRSLDDTKETETLKKMKLQLEVRRLQLEVWEKEKALNVIHSPFTSDIKMGQQDEYVAQTLLNNDCYVINSEGNIVMFDNN